MATGPPPMSPYSRFRSYSPPGSNCNYLEKPSMGGGMRRSSQPTFTRLPSRRAQRRVVEGQEMSGGFVENSRDSNNQSGINNSGNLLGQSSNCLAHSQSRQNNNPSPRSTRSAPWTQSQPRGLYTSSSPRSVRSAGTAPAVSISSLHYHNIF